MQPRRPNVAANVWAAAAAVVACVALGMAQTTETWEQMELLRQRADTAARQGEWEEAASLYRSALSGETDCAWAHRGLADIYRANGAWDKAAGEYDAAASIDPPDPDARELGLLARKALAEAERGFVAAETFRAMARFRLSWIESPEAQSKRLVLDRGHTTFTEQRIPVQVRFRRGQFALASLAPVARRQLEEVAAAIRASGDNALKIEVEGHTCQCGSDPVNLELGRKRAEAVREFLISKRVAPAESIAVVSFGSSRPVESAGFLSLPAEICERDPFHSRNRRVVVVAYEVKPQPERRPPLAVEFLYRRAGTSTYEPLSDGSRLRSGDEFGMRFHPGAEVYVYAFHLGSSGKWSVLFPGNTGSTQPEPLSNPLRYGKDISLIGDAGFSLNGGSGTEETYVYARTVADDSLEALVTGIWTGQVSRLVAPVAEETGPVESKDLARLEGAARLPPDPAAHVRFAHVE